VGSLGGMIFGGEGGGRGGLTANVLDACFRAGADERWSGHSEVLAPDRCLSTLLEVRGDCKHAMALRTT
jgi:hypothetical protein